eukprot:gb/GFBE01034452.1/.p1 GENE.gb/GFBE01034452.1/~~gb/GFBE01034452.1/.p1  ORF type:complete len:808 (+),score=170.50 gb/GFBE01034452.1/:1-2424(+)
MGSGSSVPSKRREAAPAVSDHHHLFVDVVRRAGEGDQDAQDEFFQHLCDRSAEGDLDAVKKLWGAWEGSAKILRRGAVAATCAAAEKGQDDCLKYLLDQDVKPYIGRDDPDVNPLLGAVEGKHWKCIELLLPRALKYKFSTTCLQEGLMDFVIAGDVEMVRGVLKMGLQPSSKMICCALLLGPSDKAKDMLEVLREADCQELSSRTAMASAKGWEDFAPIHAACLARGDALSPGFVQHLLDAGVDLSKWGKQLSEKSRFAKRLPLHYAAENPDASTELVEQLASCYPEAMFASVNDVAGRDLPCQCAGKHSKATQKALERLMYKHLCQLSKSAGDLEFAGALRLAKQAIKFEKVRSIPDAELGDGNITELVDGLLVAQLRIRCESKQEDYWKEVMDYEKQNPVVDLGKEEHTSIKPKTMADLGAVLKSDFWEMLMLVDTIVREKSGETLPSLRDLEAMLCQEVKARLDWVASIVANKKDARNYMASRYGLFISGSILAAGAAQDDSQGDGDGPNLASLSTSVTELARASFEAICAAYAEELELPEEWDLAKSLAACTDAGSGMRPPIFSAGNLVLRRALPRDHAHFIWLQDLFARTFLKRYTRDRGKAKVPERLELCEVEQVFNCGSWAEYAQSRKAVTRELMGSGPAWTGTVRTDEHEAGEPPSWRAPGVDSNEHWLFHGTSAAGEEGITEGDFRLNLAGSNVGTLYGNGVYMAECVSKSDEYTKSHSGGLRSILVCCASMGRVNYNDDKRPDPDEMKDSCSGTDPKFHCVLGDREKIRGTYREIVFFNENLIYPAFTCRYRRVVE